MNHLMMQWSLSLINLFLPPKVGYKPAGGLRSWRDALEFTALVHSMLGPGWVNREYFRIGASSLLGGIESRIYNLLHNTAPRSGDLALM
ncbi:unnamed protein product [Hydatigera taeniaeformis]|uniref:Secreted protein n=1 Tax=Hydatigena taeniaeformis TaxID=6205 RepID=A0A0R3XB83_HYDTA|nr:unnamed protein product [Hydatigera taeniaeformis]